MSQCLMNLASSMTSGRSITPSHAGLGARAHTKSWAPCRPSPPDVSPVPEHHSEAPPADYMYGSAPSPMYMVSKHAGPQAGGVVQDQRDGTPLVRESRVAPGHEMVLVDDLHLDLRQWLLVLVQDVLEDLVVGCMWRMES
eukprot:CAMPEP_0118949940 /NCGR_PEP_ID=MMETSP1169-20130426/50525_1 /TAXON_ID=36882 /ORGANISM="Pyramimonas obovata, Strain CCMP722" /LENGTH=139 /DNA_ID=CAMNT_0006896675 /DNA_START=60 /DNA_END=480 /DNA_ORIENTATION=-